MTIISKILVFLSITTVSASFVYVSYKQNEIYKRQKDLESSILLQKDIGDDIKRSMAQYATQKDIEQILKENKIDADKINRDMQSLGAKIDRINITVASSAGYELDDIPSTNIEPIPSSELLQQDPLPTSCKLPQNYVQDKWGYFGNTQQLSLIEKFKDVDVPIGIVGFSAPKEKPWSVSIYSRDYKLITTSTVREDGRVINYNSLTLIVDGKEYTVPIVASTYQTLPEYKFRWFSPQIYLGLDAGLITKGSGFFGPSLNLGLMNYGMYANQPDFSILQFGIAFDADSRVNYISITPAAYNIGKHIPFIRNTYVGASFNFSPPTGESAITAGLRVGL